ncbi:MAG: ATPase with chaperone activity, ATP-binding subunit [candidate division WS6 bacterium GW2011_GWF2_39_15]|uniref:ATPase with chaperone activity, ATP-binding subunit n=1 Tax=candidate division WS6 bacterium GW2011_GWF2_39_15 TaxID=1619100 RepID=A0A0G0MQ96_9BACT|nr:MAG: ATPase with chaperone activity, ATP-binding subunit [candidate division WS6 bacterium GW2011_GWF2_39_15]
MAIEFEQTNKIVYGYHNRDNNKYSIIKNKYPIIGEKNFQQFMVTRDSIFTVSESDITKIAKGYTSFNIYQDIQRKLANAIIIPGIVVSLSYVLKIFGDTQYLVALENIIPNRIINTVFWLAALGVILLWFTTYRKFTSPYKLPQLKAINETELDLIKSGDIKFGRYSQLNTIDYLSEGLLDYFELLDRNKYQISSIIPYLLKDDLVMRMFKRSGLENLSNTLTNDPELFKDLNAISLEGFRSLILYACEEALVTGSRDLQPVHLFLALFRVLPGLVKELQKRNSTQRVLRQSYIYEKDLDLKISKSFFDPDFDYHKTNGVAKSWAYGYTFILNHFSREINEEVANSFEKFGIGHMEEVEELVSIIGKIGKRNALLIGDPGVGKSSLIKGLAQRINNGDVPPQLIGKRIVQLDLNGMIAYSSNLKNTEAVVQKAMDELKRAGNTILYIDELQELIPAKADESGHSLAGILLPYILEGHFPVIGTVNYANYKKYFYTNESFRQSFNNIEVKELSQTDTITILQSKVEKLEDLFKLYITTPALTAAAELAQRYIHDRMLPDSAVDVLESACSWAQSNNVPVLTTEHVSKIVSIQTNIDVESVSTLDVDKVIKLEEKIKSKVIGQDEAVGVVVEAIKRSKTGIRNPNKPIGVFMFIGPTGVGKTYLAKVLAQEFFSAKSDIVRIDMSEYQDEGSVNRLLGGSSNSEQSISLVDKIKKDPYSVVLFDEIEKANPQVLDLFLQIFDEGRVTSISGETINFTNSIIICTSNIASDMIMKNFAQNMLWEQIKDLVLIELKQSVRPELFNRFDNIVVFSPQSIATLAQISSLLLGELASRLSEQGVTVTWESTIPMLIASKAYDPALGARPIKRYIQENIEGNIANEIINEGKKPGSTIKIKESWII